MTIILKQGRLIFIASVYSVSHKRSLSERIIFPIRKTFNDCYQENNKIPVLYLFTNHKIVIIASYYRQLSTDIKM